MVVFSSSDLMQYVCTYVRSMNRRAALVVSSWYCEPFYHIPLNENISSFFFQLTWHIRLSLVFVGVFLVAWI